MAVEHHAHVDGLAVVVERLITLEPCVRQILVAYVLALHAGLHAAIVEGQDVVQDEVGRERQRCVAETLHRTVRQRHVPVLSTVFRQRGVGIPAEPVCGFPRCLQFYAQAITLTDVLGDGLADVVQLARQHKLIPVTHPVDVDSSREVLALELIASLEVVQALGLQLRVEIVLIVVARRLFVGDGIRGIDLVVGRDVVVQAELGVEEVERIVDHVSAIGIGAVPVARILHLNADMPVLKVEEAV